MPEVGGAWEPGEGSNSVNMDNVMNKLKTNGQHGIVVSGCVAWIAVQLDMNAEGVWMETAKQCWLPGEATEAKKALKEASGDNLKDLEGFNTARRSKEKELGDIVNALKYLRDNNKMPLVLADPVMLRRAPQPGFSVHKTNGDVMERINVLEKTMAGFMTKTEKHMEENKTEFEKLAETVIRSQPKSPRFPLLQIPTPGVQESPGTKKRKYEESRAVFQQPPAASTTFQQPQHYGSVVSGVSALSGQQQEQIRSLQQLMNSQQKKQKQQPPRQRNICYGTAKPTGENSSQDMLAADVSLVASGLDKECTEQKLQVFLEERGIHPVKIEMMKKLDMNEAETKTWRTKSFKVTVKAAEHEMSLKPEIWPYRVAVRYWRAERKPRSGGWDQQSRTSGGQFSSGQSGGRQFGGGQFGGRQFGGGQFGGGQFGGGQTSGQQRNRLDSQGWQQQQPRGRGGSAGGGQQQEQPLDISNRFASLLPQINVSTVVEPSASKWRVQIFRIISRYQLEILEPLQSLTKCVLSHITREDSVSLRRK